MVAVTFQPRAAGATMSTLSSTQLEAFMKDRAELTKGAPIVTFPPDVAEAHLAHYLGELDGAFKAPFLFGSKPNIADFSVYHCLWLVANNPIMAQLLEPYPNVTAWRARMAAFGHGNVTEITGEEALAVGDTIDADAHSRSEVAVAGGIRTRPAGARSRRPTTAWRFRSAVSW